jgi:hypothetical protein
VDSTALQPFSKYSQQRNSICGYLQYLISSKSVKKLGQFHLHCAALRCAALRCTALRCTALRCAALRCAALRCAALHCTALHCTALHPFSKHSQLLNSWCGHLQYLISSKSVKKLGTVQTQVHLHPQVKYESQWVNFCNTLTFSKTYTKFHENLTKSLVNGTASQIERQTDRHCLFIRHSIL